MVFLITGALKEERCKMLNWNSLEHRREYFSLVEYYKVVFGNREFKIYDGDGQRQYHLKIYTMAPS